MIHVPDPDQGLAWYADLLGVAPVEVVPGYRVLPLGGLEVCFHSADAKVASGLAGTVLYWEVPDFPAARARVESLGAQLHRGPLAIEGGRIMAQFRDPFGNLLGLVGPDPGT